VHGLIDAIDFAAQVGEGGRLCHGS
jgi:hypothetical protein